MKYKGYSFKKDNKSKWFGDLDEKKKTVKVNVKKSKKKGGNKEVLNSILHEKNHIDNPRMKEKSVYRKTLEQMKIMTKKHKKRIYSLIK